MSSKSITGTKYDGAGRDQGTVEVSVNAMGDNVHLFIETEGKRTTRILIALDDWKALNEAVTG